MADFSRRGPCADGRIKPLIDRVFPFDQVPEAARYMNSDAQTGKIVIRVDA